ncbi:MAG TPA: ATP-binding cassette domain-containing protein, partial [Polyangiales bacterium]|nr:ATP-binding cassette domain-containing protein [Polyangiales bacterium]
YRRSIRKPGLWGSISGLFSNQVKEVPAVKQLSLSVRLGERVGLIGENGAGKSTTLKMLTGILVPSAGSLRVLGKEPWRERRSLAREIGVVFGQRPQLLWDIPVRETFRLLKTMYDVPAAVYDVTYKEAVRRLELEPLLGVPVRQLSLGQRMRCDLAASLLHAPKIAFLDEPTIGLDVSVKEQVREFIREMQQRFGTTLLITTHDLKDITETCDRLLLLDRGELLFDGSLPDFERRFGSGRRIRFELEKAVSAQALPELSAAIAELGGKLTDSSQHQLKVEYEREGAAPQLIQLVMARLAVVDIVLEKADIEGIVARIYRRQVAVSAPE